MGKAKKALKAPKTKCCVSSTKCGRCPLRMLKEGTLPEGYTVKKRRLMVERADGTLTPASKNLKVMVPATKRSGKKKSSGSKKKLAKAA